MSLTRHISRQTKLYFLFFSLVLGAKLIEISFDITYYSSRLHVPIPGIIIYGILGYGGLKITQRLNWPQIMPTQLDLKRHILQPFFIGLLFGTFLIFFDYLLTQSGYTSTPQAQLPQGILVVVIAGITEEILFRLFGISVLAWITQRLFRVRNKVSFWFSNSVIAVGYAFIVLTVYLNLYEISTISQIPFMLYGIFIVSALYGLFAGNFLRRFGFTSTLSIRFGLYTLWHLGWPLLQQGLL